MRDNALKASGLIAMIKHGYSKFICELALSTRSLQAKASIFLISSTLSDYTQARHTRRERVSRSQGSEK
jgi:hypothetical protein